MGNSKKTSMEQAIWLRLLRQQRILAVIRASDVTVGLEMARAVHRAGLRLIEITWTSDRPVQLIERLRNEFPDAWIGAGTLLSPADLQAAITAGAQFGFSPHSDPRLIQLAQEQSLPLTPGALSPTEIVSAWQAGASGVKVFPVMALGGAAYIRSLQGPLGHIPLIPTGGVTLDNALPLLNAGAIALGLSTSLFPADAVAQQDWLRVTQAAQQLLRRIEPFLSD